MSGTGFARTRRRIFTIERNLDKDFRTEAGFEGFRFAPIREIRVKNHWIFRSFDSVGRRLAAQQSRRHERGPTPPGIKGVSPADTVAPGPVPGCWCRDCSCVAEPAAKARPLYSIRCLRHAPNDSGGLQDCSPICLSASSVSCQRQFAHCPQQPTTQTNNQQKEPQ